MAGITLPRSGIYCITHVETGRIYVGSAVHIERRWAVHRCNLKKGEHHSPYLQRVWDKYGEYAFSFSILERVADVTCLISREQYWIDHFGSANSNVGFNISPKANSRLGVKQGYARTKKQIDAMERTHKGKIVSPETRMKLSISGKARNWKPTKLPEWTPEMREAMSIRFTGRVFSEEARAKMSAASLGKPKSPDAVRNRAAAQTGLKRSPQAIANLKAGAAKRTFTDEQRAEIGERTRMQHQRRRDLLAVHGDD